MYEGWSFVEELRGFSWVGTRDCKRISSAVTTTWTRWRVSSWSVRYICLNSFFQNLAARTRSMWLYGQSRRRWTISRYWCELELAVRECTDRWRLLYIWATAMGQSQSRWNAEPSHSPPQPQMVKNSPLVDLHSIVLHIIFVALLESSDLSFQSSFLKINLWVLHIFPSSRVVSIYAR